MYSKEELLIFSFLNSTSNIEVQNLVYKIFNFSNTKGINFFKLNKIKQTKFLKLFFYETTIEKIFKIFDKIYLYKLEVEKIIKNCEEKK